MSDNFTEVIKALANTKTRVCVTASAGCGKTEAIVQAVNKSVGKQLVLTHTNAGIAALRSRFRKNSVDESKYRISTIASWLLKYSTAYKSMSGLTDSNPKGNTWNKVYPSANNLFAYPFIRDVLEQTYSGIFIDEYQDCTKQQHKIILKMGEYLPIRVFGDPLQGIFGFNTVDPIVNWKYDIQNEFENLPDLDEPFRWQKTPKHPDSNPLLGEQIAEIRKRIVSHELVNLESYSQIKWYSWSEEEEKKLCLDYAKTKSGQIAGIHASIRGNNLDLRVAKKLNGVYQYVEEMDCYSLLDIAKHFDYCHKSNVCIRKNFELFLSQNIGNYSNSSSEFKEYLLNIETQGFSALPEIIDYALKACLVYRKELFNELKKATLEYLSGNHPTFLDAAYIARSKTRNFGRQPEKRIISRTLLIKGLEFDHAIVLNADYMKETSHPNEHFYVAITRASQSLAVLSSSPTIKFI